MLHVSQIFSEIPGHFAKLLKNAVTSIAVKTISIGLSHLPLRDQLLLGPQLVRLPSEHEVDASFFSISQCLRSKIGRDSIPATGWSRREFLRVGGVGRWRIVTGQFAGDQSPGCCPRVSPCAIARSCCCSCKAVHRTSSASIPRCPPRASFVRPRVSSRRNFPASRLAAAFRNWLSAQISWRSSATTPAARRAYVSACRRHGQ